MAWALLSCLGTICLILMKELLCYHQDTPGVQVQQHRWLINRLVSPWIGTRRVEGWRASGSQWHRRWAWLTTSPSTGVSGAELVSFERLTPHVLGTNAYLARDTDPNTHLGSPNKGPLLCGLTPHCLEPISVGLFLRHWADGWGIYMHSSGHYHWASSVGILGERVSWGSLGTRHFPGEKWVGQRPGPVQVGFKF